MSLCCFITFGSVHLMEAKFTSIVTYWIRLHFEDNEKLTQFPLDIIELIVNVFYSAVQFLKFSSEFKDRNIVLTNNDKTAGRDYSGPACPQVLVDCEPVKSGIHVWRTKV